MKTGSLSLEHRLAQNISFLRKASAFIFLALFSAELYFLFGPSVMSLIEARQLQEELVRLRQKKEHLLNLSESRVLERGRMADINRALVGQDDPVPFLETLEKLAQEEGVLLEVKMISAEQPKGSLLKYLYFNLFVKGDGISTRRFLERVESLPFFVTIEEVRWQSTEEGIELNLILKGIKEKNL